MIKIFFFALFICVNLGISTHVFAQRYFKGRVYETWLKQKDSMNNDFEESNQNIVKSNTIKIDTQTYRRIYEVEAKLTGKKIVYKNGYYVFEDGKVAFSNYNLLKEYCVAAGCKKAFRHVNGVKAIGVLASIGITVGAIYWMSENGLGLQSINVAYLGIALTGLSLPLSKSITKKSVLRRYNKCVEKSDLENKKSLIPTHLKLGAMPTSQGAGIGLGLIWKF
jgi:hypothetical protein